MSRAHRPLALRRGRPAPTVDDRDASRADWMELFFDLVFVVLVGQLSAGLRTHPDFADVGVFLALFSSVWWSWVNLTFSVNIQEHLSRRALAGYMLAAMAAMGAIAVAAPGATASSGWLFALGNAALRGVMLGLWVRRSWSAGAGARIRVLAYNGATGILWLASAFVPAPGRFLLWAVAIVVEIVLLVVTAPGLLRRLGTVNVEHLAERFGTLVIIALGESVLAIVNAVSASLSPMVGLAAGLALVITACLAWSMFMFGVDSMRAGLERLVRADDSRGLVETFAFLPYLLVAGVMMLAGALSAAISAPAGILPVASGVTLGAGVALFYGTNALVSRRYGNRWRVILPWALPAVLLPLAVSAGAAWIPAVWVLGAMACVLVAVVVIAERLARRKAVAKAGVWPG
ncbi:MULTISPECIES: low temperature requirement protein A [Arthrobacter]|uniref:Low temperature requirement protein A n=2 Tax=Arthrobacter TaxID=1663 RepID=A0ABU9KPC9_9MICC|nr:low temperature requirement protein A [Arthrobacter sp. YJM1]MDP5228635.1 low temperature requirement protein A [Arthrobacter sp. YJM1]